MGDFKKIYADCLEAKKLEAIEDKLTDEISALKHEQSELEYKLEEVKWNIKRVEHDMKPIVKQKISMIMMLNSEKRNLSRDEQDKLKFLLQNAQ
jgi:hypothetical protein